MQDSLPTSEKTVATSVWSVLQRRVEALKKPLSHVETVIGLATGVISIAGALFGVGEYFKAPPPDKGQIVAIIEDAKTQQTLSGATVEVITGKQTVLTTITTNWFGRASHHLGEGQYKVRVSHPKFTAETRQVQVVTGQTTEIRVGLRQGSGGLHGVERAINKGVNAVRALFD